MNLVPRSVVHRSYKCQRRKPSCQHFPLFTGLTRIKNWSELLWQPDLEKKVWFMCLGRWTKIIIKTQCCAKIPSYKLLIGFSSAMDNYFIGFSNVSLEHTPKPATNSLWKKNTHFARVWGCLAAVCSKGMVRFSWLVAENLRSFPHCFPTRLCSCIPYSCRKPWWRETSCECSSSAALWASRPAGFGFNHLPTPAIPLQ